MTSIRFQALLIFILGIILFTIGLGHEEIVGFESRFYLFALEMWRHGPSWFPTTYHMPYPDYPGTSTFLIYLVAKWMGELNKWVAVFPSACAAAITLAVTYLIGALHSRVWGICAVGFLLFTVVFVTEARSISLDQYITAVTVSCFYLMYSAKVLQKPERVKWIFLLWIVGFVFRGPLGLVIPTGVVCLFYLLEKEWKIFLKMAIVATLLLILCGSLMLGLAYQTGGNDFLQQVLQMQVLGRMHEMRTPSRSFYFIESMGAYAITYPLAVLVLPGVYFYFKKEKSSAEIRLILQCVGWVLIILLGMSIPADKKVRYILPIAPALALICGYLYVVGENKYFKALRRGLSVLCFFLPMIALGLLWFVHCDCPELRLFFTVSSGLLIMLQLAMIFCYRFPIVIFFAAVGVFLVTMISVVEPVKIYLNRARDFVLQAENFREQQHAALVFYREGRDGLVIKYLVNMPNEATPVFINEIGQLQEINRPAIIITTADNYAKIPQNITNSFVILFKKKLGREEMVVFSKNVSHPQAES